MPHTPSRRSRMDYAALADFRYEIRRFLNFAQHAAQQAGIEPQQYQALLALRALSDKQTPTVGALADRMQLRHHSAVELSTRLERSGWIRRRRSTADRREVFLPLTARGEHLLEKLSRLHRNELRIAAPRLIRALQTLLTQTRRSQKRGARASSKRK